MARPAATMVVAAVVDPALAANNATAVTATRLVFLTATVRPVATMAAVEAAADVLVVRFVMVGIATLPVSPTATVSNAVITAVVARAAHVVKTRRAMNRAIANLYANLIAKENNVVLMDVVGNAVSALPTNTVVQKAFA